MTKHTYAGKAAIVGIGATEFSKNSGRSELQLALEACVAACDDAGIEPSQVNGLSTFTMETNPESEILRGLGIPELTHFSRIHFGGGAPCATVQYAAMAVASGVADYVLCYRAFNERSGRRFGAGVQGRPAGVTAEEADAYLAPTLRHYMPDPSRLTDMDKAAERLADAVMARESIAIFGDYDVDGATSSALLAGWLREVGVPARIHIPDRIYEGYGPNEEAIRLLRADGASLLVTVDCGTTSVDVLGKAAELGFETLVVDHHPLSKAGKG